MEVRKVENFTRGENIEFSTLDPYNKDFEVPTGSSPLQHRDFNEGGPDYSGTGIMRDKEVHKVKADSSQEILLEKEGNKIGQ